MVSQAKLISKSYHSLVPCLISNFFRDGMGPCKKALIIVWYAAKESRNCRVRTQQYLRNLKKRITRYYNILVQESLLNNDRGQKV